MNRPTPLKYPATCPHCGRRTADNFTAPAPAGRHCHRDNTEAWRTHCLTLVCACGRTYTNYKNHYTRSTQ